MAERLYHNCEVYTVDASRPRAEAVAVRGEEIVAVGFVEECRAALGTGHEEVDLGGGALLPGFIDTHIHPVMLAFFEMNAALGKARSIADVQDILSESAAEAGEGAWVLGLDFDDQKLAEKRMPGRQEIDRGSGVGRPSSSATTVTCSSRTPPRSRPAVSTPPLATLPVVSSTGSRTVTPRGRSERPRHRSSCR